MKIIDASYKIYPLHGTSEEDVLKHIEYCGRICYQSRGKITGGSAKKFVGRVKKLGHGSVMEMANIIVKVWQPLPSYFEWFSSPYIQKSLDPKSPDVGYFSGSPRAFLEVLEDPKPRRTMIAKVLQKKYPFLFGQVEGNSRNEVTIATCLNNAQIVELPQEIKELHCKVAVEFTVNRAFSHELVRHRPCSYLQESQRYCRYGDDVVFIMPIFKCKHASYSVWLETMKFCEDNYKALLEIESPQAARNVLPNSVKTSIICYASIKQWMHILKQRCSSKCDPNMYFLMRRLRRDFINFLRANLAVNAETEIAGEEGER